MAISASRVSVGTTATALTPSGDASSSAVVRNADATVSVFLGGSGVTTATGYELKAGEQLAVDLAGVAETGGDRLFGIVATGTVTVHVLSTGV